MFSKCQNEGLRINNIKIESFPRCKSSIYSKSDQICVFSQFYTFTVMTFQIVWSNFGYRVVFVFESYNLYIYMYVVNKISTNPSYKVPFNYLSLLTICCDFQDFVVVRFQLSLYPLFYKCIEMFTRYWNVRSLYV